MKKMIFLIFYSILANAAAGDLILDTEILFPYPDPHEATTLGTTLLKEGYSLSLDDVYDHADYTQTVAVLTIYKNKEIVKRTKVKTGDYIYYNKTISGREYTIIESKLDAIFRGTPNNMVMLRPFYQYSDGIGDLVEYMMTMCGLSSRLQTEDIYLQEKKPGSQRSMLMELNNGAGHLGELAMTLLILSGIRWMAAIFSQEGRGGMGQEVMHGF